VSWKVEIWNKRQWFEFDARQIPDSEITVPTLEYQQLILDDIEKKLTNVAFLEAQIDDSFEQAEACASPS